MRSVASEFGTPTNFSAHNPTLRQVLLRAENADSITTDRKLGLHIGEDGVIGRTISLEVQGRVVGEGVIGWL